MAKAKSATRAPESGRRTRAARTEQTRPARAVTSSVDRIFFLQRTVGNQAVETLLAGAVPALPQRIQRQPSTLTEVQFKFAPIKEHVKTRFPELHKLIADNPFNGTFANAHSEQIDGKTHTWQISVKFTDLGLGKRGMTGPAESPAGKPHIHRIRTLINTFSFEDEDLKKRIPDATKREEFRHAETLTHELIHASVLIQEQGALRTDSSGVVVGYKKMLETAKSRATEKARLDVLSNISLILLYLELFEKDDDERDRFIDRQLDDLVEEKYAYQTARSSFGRSIDNQAVAKLYVDDFVRKQQRKSKSTEKESHQVNLTRVHLIDATKQFYDTIDAELAASAQPAKQEPSSPTEQRPPTEHKRRVFGPEP